MTDVRAEKREDLERERAGLPPPFPLLFFPPFPILFIPLVGRRKVDRTRYVYVRFSDSQTKRCDIGISGPRHSVIPFTISRSEGESAKDGGC